MDRVTLERKLNEGRDWLLGNYGGLSEEQLRRPLTVSQHDSESRWSALDHFAHLALIERNFAAIVRRHVAGRSDPVGLWTNELGQPRSREEVMASVHQMTEEWQQAHHLDTFSEVVALTSAAREATIQLIAELSDAQLQESIPGAPWADGTISGVLGANVDHGRSHWKWVEEAGLLTE